MKTLEAASNYARALFHVAQKQNRIEEVLSELKAMARILDGQPEFKKLLTSPSLGTQRKETMVSETLEKALSPLVIFFLKLLIEKKRLDELDLIVAQYERFVESSQNRAEAKVISAFPLAKDLSERLKARLEEATRYRIRLTSQVDPTLIGGAVIMVKNKVIDLSLKRRLEELREKLKC